MVQGVPARLAAVRPCRFAALAGAVLLAAACPGWASPPPAPRHHDGDKVHGVIVSTHTSGREWGGEGMESTLDDIVAVGANWVAIHPYAGIGEDGSVWFRPIDPSNPPAHLVRPIREAHRRGLKILIMPHLAYWGSSFSWRGEIHFRTAEQWSRFWRDYSRWIVSLAAACRDADGFVVGTELDRTLDHPAEWRRIIARVRGVTKAPLTYAANWTDYARVPFWDALDVIGIQAYFPLSDSLAPAASTLEAAWRRRMAEIHAFAERRGKWALFTELGYNRSLDAAHEPWDSRLGGPEAEAFQATCLRVALEAVDREPRVVGAFLWKWFPNPYPVGRTFQLATPRLKRAIEGVWMARRVGAKTDYH